MRYLFTILVLYFAATTCRGQEVLDFSSRVNEVNIGFNKTSDYDATTILGYKHLINGGALRAGTELHFSSNESGSESIDFTYQGFAVAPKLGYEYHKWYGRLKIHYGADLVYSFGRSKNEEGQTDPEENEPDIRRVQKIGVRPLAGMSIFIFNSLSISVESYFDLSYHAVGDKDPGSEDTWSNSLKGVTAKLVPLGLFSINYHF